MSITFPTTDQKVPSGITALPSAFKRPAFGTLYGFDAQGGGAAYSNTASVRFDGTNDYISLTSQIEFTGPYTFSIWVHPIDSAEGWISAGNAGAGGPWLDWYGSAWGYTFVVRNMGDINGTSGDAQPGSWYHIVLIRDGSNVVKMYVNGSQQGSNSTFTGTAQFSHFAARPGPVSPLNGYLDEIAFWDSDQTSNLSAMSDSGAAADLSGLSPTHWYRMGDINGSFGVTIVNQGGAGSNDGTLINGPTYSTEVPS